MAEIVIRTLVDPEDAALNTVADHFQAMYGELSLAHGINDEGKAYWVGATKRALDRTLFVELVEVGGVVIASMHGTIVMSPAYLGGERVAMVQHLYVQPDQRKKGIAKRLASAWIEAMKKRGISKFQLHVTVGNESGMAFWKSIGFDLELNQLAMRTL